MKDRDSCTSTARLKINPLLASMLACPVCAQPPELKPDRVTCPSCARSFRVHDGVPVFADETPEVVPTTHRSNPLGPEFEALLRRGDRLTLHIGAGATAMRYPNCIEFERKIFRHTDVVGDAHHLPLRDGVFDQVFAFNVFEHLRDPKTAAAEIFRVLKPEGSVAIHTAFLQALHEEPAHFYNATEYGLREWFSQFQIEHCAVSANFSPAYMIAFLMSNVLEATRAGQTSAAEQEALSQTSIGEWAAFWARGSDPPPGFNMLQNLSQPLQKRIAAGFELLARKPSV